MLESILLVICLYLQGGYIVTVKTSNVRTVIDYRSKLHYNYESWQRDALDDMVFTRVGVQNIVYCDRQNAIDLSKNMMCHVRTKYIYL